MDYVNLIYYIEMTSLSSKLLLPNNGADIIAYQNVKNDYAITPLPPGFLTLTLYICDVIVKSHDIKLNWNVDDVVISKKFTLQNIIPNVTLKYKTHALGPAQLNLNSNAVTYKSERENCNKTNGYLNSGLQKNDLVDNIEFENDLSGLEIANNFADKKFNLYKTDKFLNSGLRKNDLVDNIEFENDLSGPEIANNFADKKFKACGGAKCKNKIYEQIYIYFYLKQNQVLSTLYTREMLEKVEEKFYKKNDVSNEQDFCSNDFYDLENYLKSGKCKIYGKYDDSQELQHNLDDIQWYEYSSYDCSWAGINENLLNVKFKLNFKEEKNERIGSSVRGGGIFSNIANAIKGAGVEK